MGGFEVQGIVSTDNGLPFVQLRQVDEEDRVVAKFQLTPAEARDIAQAILEASTNSVYDAALYTWAKEAFPDDDRIGYGLVTAIRQYRADKWGLPDQPKDWQKD